MHKRELTCIICPAGCLLTAEYSATDSEARDNMDITGNKCKRGLDYAVEEIFSPKRIVTATCAILQNTGEKEGRRIPVRTSSPCPKESIHELLQDIYSLKQTLPVKAGQILINNWKGSGIDVIASRTFD